MGSQRTCLHAVLSLLNHGVDSRTGPVRLYETPQLAELAYHVIHQLCANKDTSDASMRYLRTHDFLYRHLQHIPFTLHDSVPSSAALENLLLSQQSWLLKVAAVELRLTSVKRQRSHTQRLMTLLLDDAPNIPQRGVRGDGTADPDYTQYDLEYSMFTSSQIQFHQTITGGQARRKILSVLDSIDFAQERPPTLALEFFNPTLIEQVISACLQRGDSGATYTDVKLLHRILRNELNNLQGSAATGQRPLIVQEIQSICANVVERNTFRESVHCKRHAFDSWRHVVEITLTACPEDLLQGEPRQSLIFELLQDLLLKVSKEDVSPELSSPVAGVILTLLANLRHCFMADPMELSSQDAVATSHYITMLDGAEPAGAGHMTMFNQGGGSRTLFASSLQVVLRGLVEHLMRSSSGSQRVRAYLYGALLYFLQIAQRPRAIHGLDAGAGESTLSKLTSKESEYERLGRENMDTVSSYGENFMELICRDACDGHDVGRMLSLAALDLLMSMDQGGQWLAHMSSKGYLQHIVESLVQDDEQLQTMLQPHPEPMKALYIFESKIGLLTRVGETAIGAHTLLQCGLTTRLAECNIFDCRPDTDRPSEGFIPSVLSRYRHQIMFPVLKLCLAVLTSMGIENRQSRAQVLKFVLSHVDVFIAILRDRESAASVESLQELALTTALVSRAAVDEGLDDVVVGDTASMEVKGLLSRLQRQMLALLPKYCLNDKLPQHLASLETSAAAAVAGASFASLGGATTGLDSRVTAEAMRLAMLEVSSNVVAFCRLVVSKSGINAKMFRILFGPSLLEAMSRDMRRYDEMQSSISNATRPQNLGVVVYMLQQATTKFLSTFESHSQHVHKCKHVNDLSNEEVKELCGGPSSEKMSSQQRHQLARRRLHHITSHKAQHLKLYSYIIENCMFILWRHLEFYLVHCVPADSGNSLFRLHARTQQQMRRLQEPPGYQGAPDYEEDEHALSLSVGVTRDELDQLKQDTIVTINETLFKRLQEIEQCYSKGRTRYGFVEALIRRLKRLLRMHTATS